MMHQFRDKREIIFIIKIRAMNWIGGENKTISDTDEITIGGILLYRGSRVIIDDILLWASNLQVVLLYFECVCKCDFLKDRVEYVGHDLTPTGNCPAKSKFKMIALDYDGPITMIKRWAQELLGYHFTVVHRVQHMMRDVDSLNRFYGNSVQTYTTIAIVFADDDKSRRPAAYDPATFRTALDPTKIGKDAPIPPAPPHILTNTIIGRYLDKLDNEDEVVTSADKTIHTSPIFITTHMEENEYFDGPTVPPAESPMFTAVQHLSISRLVINYTMGSTLHWARNAAMPPITWDHQIVFLEQDHSNLFRELFPTESFRVCSLIQSLDTAVVSTSNIIDIFFIPYSSLGNIIHWIHAIFDALESQFEAAMGLMELNLWSPSQFVTPTTQTLLLKVTQKRIPEDWAYECNHYNAAKFGGCVLAMRCHIQIVKMCENGRGACSKFKRDWDAFTPIGYGEHMLPVLNDSLREFSIHLPSEFSLEKE